MTRLFMLLLDGGIMITKLKFVIAVEAELHVYANSPQYWTFGNVSFEMIVK